MLRQADPARLGRFQIRERLGRGAQGEVYLAEDTRLDRRVAIKTIRLNSRDPSEQSRRVFALLEEARIVSQLAHSGIVTLYDAGEDAGVPYLVFEYVEGRTLAARLREAQRLSPAEAVDIAIQVLKALGYAHVKGVVHRDIKPGNVMLAAGTARVMDFGIAQVLCARPTADDTFTGTPAYLAPEYISEGKYTEASDVFAVGMLLYTMLTGRPAICGENAFETLHRQEILASYFAGLVGRELVAQAGIQDGEEAFICALFHSLGRLVTAYYLHEEFQEICRLQRTQGLDEARASAQVLGLSFEDLGIGVGAAWNFPDRLLHSMRRITDEKVRRPTATDERLRVLADLAAGLCACLREPDAERRRARIAALASRHQALGITQVQLETVAQGSLAELVKDTALFGIAPATSELVASLSAACRAGRQQPGNESAVPAATGDTAAPAAGATGAASSTASGSAERSAILNAGIQDITNSLVGDCELNDILRMILETMYRGIGFTRVLLCVRDPASNSLKARFGFGSDVDQILRRGFEVPLAAGADAFHVAISNGADLFIENVDAERVRDHIPDWYRRLVPARSLALFPLMMKNKPIGLFYGDSDNAGALSFDPAELNLLKTLRNQAVLAIRQRG